MNASGQSFDVFKLLIAAVIAVVILSVLMSIIGQIITPTGQPIDVAKRLLSTMRNPSYNVATSEAVIFKKNDSLNADALAEAAKGEGLLPEQICLSTGKFTEEGGWYSSSNYSIAYKGSSNTQVKFVGVCGKGEKLTDTFFDNAGVSSTINAGMFSECSCLSDPDLAESDCCLLIVSRNI